MRKAWRTDRAQGHAAPAQRQGRVGPRDTRQRRAARREEGGKLRHGDKGGEPSREHPGHSLPLQSGTRAGAAADHGEAWPGEGPGAAGPGVARRRPRAPGGGGGGTWAGARRREREGAGGAGLAAPAAPLGPLAHRWPPEAGSASPAVRSRRSRSPRAEFAEEVRVPAGLREAVPAPASTCPGAGGRAGGGVPCAGLGRWPRPRRRAREASGLRRRQAVLGPAAAAPGRVPSPVGHRDLLPRGSFCYSPCDSSSRSASTASSTFSRPQAGGDFLFQSRVSVL